MERLKHLYYENRTFRCFLKIVILTVASAVYGVGVACFIDANDMATGGLIGVSIILNRWIDFSTGTWYLLLNIPIVIYGFWKFGPKLMLSTFYCILLTTFFTDESAKYIGAITHDPWLGALVGGTIVGASMGYIFKVGATTGGVDIISKALRLKYQHIKTGVLFGVMDVTIVLCSALVFPNADAIIFGIISAIVTSLAFDMVLYGRDGAKMLFIISDNDVEITDRLLKELDVGVTKLKGQGAFSKKDKSVIMVVVKKNNVPNAEAIIREEDPDSFTIISDATEIYGLGYKSIFAEKL
ncbi:MAG: YitT family protein [Lachnospiraceae bacterium]|nr:YitT family protein [Lachnospiraceae bacterium]